MPAIGNLVLKDAAATPLDHTFSPVTTNGSKGEWANRVGTTPKGFETLQLEVLKPSGGSTAYRLKAGLNDPVEATVNGVVSVVRNCSFSCSLNFSPDSTAQERLDLLALVASLFGHVTVKSMVQNLEPAY